jgi:hypothetical protein
VARTNANDLRSAEPLELVELAVVCHNLAAMSVEEMNRRLPEHDRVDVSGISPRLRGIRGGKRKQARLVH